MRVTVVIEKLAIESKLANVNKQPLKEIATVLKTVQVSEAQQSSENATMCEDFNFVANKPPIKTSVCYTVNQVEALQTLSNFTFASQYEIDEFLQKVIALIKTHDKTEIKRHPTIWSEKLRCLSSDPIDIVYMDHHLVIPKALPFIIIRS